jgi:small-conductance mechanosensitive channel
MVRPLFLISIWLAIGSAVGQETASVRPADIVAHLEQTVAWYRFVTLVADTTAADVLQRDTIRQQGLSAVRLAFEFARVEAGLLARQATSGAPNSAQPPTQSQNLQQAGARASDRVNSIQGQIQEIDAELKKAPARSRATLTAQRDALQAALGLAKEVQSTVQSLIRFAGAQESGGGPAGALTAEINQLEQSVPGAAPQQTSSNTSSSRPPASSPPATDKATSPSAQPFHAESAGIFSLFAELWTLTHARSQLNDAVKRTDELLNSTRQLRAPLTNELRQDIKRSEMLSTATGSNDPAQIAAGQHEIENLSAGFKQIAAATTPLGEQRIVVGATRGTLLQIREDLDEQYSDTGRYLLLRVGILIVAVLTVLAISAFWRRATLRYIHDARRRRQFLLLRRVVVGAAIALVLVLTFITEFGSLATYAGLLTAGIAVALQNVILSVVAYFFLIGRYGVRVGDRVTISGVTGTVIDIGLVRIYLMEMLGSGAELHATGRVVVFSNSVLFQPSAWFKQMPGTDYVWHTVRLALTPDSDFQLAQNRLSAAMDAVYQEYRQSIEQQHAAFEQTVDIQLTAPKPECRLRFTDNALEVIVQYPAPFQDAARIDERVMKALYDAIAHEPKLTLASSGAPQLATA